MFDSVELGCIYIWGALGSGRSHLLQAACHAAREMQRSAVYISLSEVKELSPEMLQDLEHSELVCIDDIEVIAGQARWEEALFHLYNEMKQRQHSLIVAGVRPPQLLSINYQIYRVTFIVGHGVSIADAVGRSKITCIDNAGT